LLHLLNGDAPLGSEPVSPIEIMDKGLGRLSRPRPCFPSLVVFLKHRELSFRNPSFIEVTQFVVEVFRRQTTPPGESIASAVRIRGDPMNSRKMSTGNSPIPLPAQQTLDLVASEVGINLFFGLKRAFPWKAWQDFTVFSTGALIPSGIVFLFFHKYLQSVPSKLSMPYLLRFFLFPFFLFLFPLPSQTDKSIRYGLIKILIAYQLKRFHNFPPYFDSKPRTPHVAT
jgi:hypothetical protein